MWVPGRTCTWAHMGARVHGCMGAWVHRYVGDKGHLVGLPIHANPPDAKLTLQLPASSTWLRSSPPSGPSRASSQQGGLQSRCTGGGSGAGMFVCCVGKGGGPGAGDCVCGGWGSRHGWRAWSRCVRVCVGGGELGCGGGVIVWGATGGPMSVHACILYLTVHRTIISCSILVYTQSTQSTLSLLHGSSFLAGPAGHQVLRDLRCRWEV